MLPAVEDLEAYVESVLFPVSSESNVYGHRKPIPAPAPSPLSRNTLKPTSKSVSWSKDVLRKGPSNKKSPPLQLKKVERVAADNDRRTNTLNQQKSHAVQRTRNTKNHEFRAKYNQRIMLRLESDREAMPQTYSDMVVKKQMNHQIARRGSSALQPSNGHRVHQMNKMNGRLVRSNKNKEKEKKKVKVMYIIDNCDSSISSSYGNSDGDSYDSGSYYSSDLSYLNDKLDQWLDRIAGIPVKRKRRW